MLGAHFSQSLQEPRKKVFRIGDPYTREGEGYLQQEPGDKSLTLCQDGVGLEGIFQGRGDMFVSYRQRRHGQGEAGEGQHTRYQ